MSQNVYESLIIFDSNKFARDGAGVSSAVSKMVKTIGGEILADRLWVEQKLAFPIDGHRKGSYWLTYFRSDSEKLVDFNRLCRLDDNILRHMVIKIDPRLVDAFVSHALGQKPEPLRDSQTDNIMSDDDDNLEGDESEDLATEAAEA